MTFTAANWNQPQIVTVTGVDDQIVDGVQPFVIQAVDNAISDTNYIGFIVNVDGNNSDDDGGSVGAPAIGVYRIIMLPLMKYLVKVLVF